MKANNLRIVVLGLSLSSSWGNGHATTYRALLSALAARGHDIVFLERNVPWYEDHRDLQSCSYCRLELYDNLCDLKRYRHLVQAADVVLVGSFVPDGIKVIDWVLEEARGIRAFYDIDTPVTLSSLEDDKCAYLARDQMPFLDLYLSFTGGPILRRLESRYGVKAARVLYCSVDPQLYSPKRTPKRWDIGYIGTYSDDRQVFLQRLLLDVALQLPQKRFVVAGAGYPEWIVWPPNVDRFNHLPPGDHAKFYSQLRWTLNLTRADMIAAGFSPSVRLFEAMACGTPVITDRWAGIEDAFDPANEIIVAETMEDVLACLNAPDKYRQKIARAGRRRALQSHTAQRRTREFELHIGEAIGKRAKPTPRTRSFAELGT